MVLEITFTLAFRPEEPTLTLSILVLASFLECRQHPHRPPNSNLTPATPPINTAPLWKDAALPSSHHWLRARPRIHSTQAMPVRHRSDPEIKCRALVRPLFSTTQSPCASQCHVHNGSYIHTLLTYLLLLALLSFPSLPALSLTSFPFSLCHHHRPPCMGLCKDKEPEKGLLLGIENWMEQVSYLYEPATKALQSPA